MIFICYRRADTQGEADHLYERLRVRYGKAGVFKDLDNREPGAFPELIRGKIQQSRVVLVLIGSEWLRVRAEAGEPRIQVPGDHVRREIEQALTAGKPIIPILVDGVRMPASAELPESIQALTDQAALPLRPGRDFDRDCADIMEFIDKAARMNPAARVVRVVPEPLRRLLIYLALPVAALLALTYAVTRAWNPLNLMKSEGPLSVVSPGAGGPVLPYRELALRTIPPITAAAPCSLRVVGVPERDFSYRPDTGRFVFLKAPSEILRAPSDSLPVRLELVSRRTGAVRGSVNLLLVEHRIVVSPDTIAVQAGASYALAARAADPEARIEWTLDPDDARYGSLSSRAGAATRLQLPAQLPGRSSWSVIARYRLHEETFVEARCQLETHSQSLNLRVPEIVFFSQPFTPQLGGDSPGEAYELIATLLLNGAPPEAGLVSGITNFQFHYPGQGRDFHIATNLNITLRTFGEPTPDDLVTLRLNVLRVPNPRNYPAVGSDFPAIPFTGLAITRPLDLIQPILLFGEGVIRQATLQVRRGPVLRKPPSSGRPAQPVTPAGVRPG